MEIVVNGTLRPHRQELTIVRLLEDEGYKGRRVAVEVNGEIVPKSRHAEQLLQPGDRIEVVQAIGGG